MFKSHKQIIDAWRSLEEFAVDAGISPNTAKQMRTRNSIQSDHWPGIIDGAAKRGIEGVTYEVLTATKPPRRSAASVHSAEDIQAA